MLTSPFADERGITLVEIMCAVAIMGIGLIALSSAIPIGSYGIHEGSHLSTATFLANQRLEQVRAAVWKRIPTGCGGVTPGVQDSLGVSASASAAPTTSCADGKTTATVTTFPDEAPMAAPYSEYTRTVRITSCATGAGCGGIVNADLRQVTVTVTYRPMTGSGVSAAGTTRSATVTMYVAKR